jgi:magnesium chelatase subunit H
MRFLFLTMDGNHNGALREAAELLRREHGIALELGLYDATKLRDEADWRRLAADATSADFVFGSMLFGEEYVRPLQAIFQQIAAPVCVITSNPALIRATRLGKFNLQKKEAEHEPGLFQQWARRFRPKGGHGEGQRQLAMLRNLGKVLQHIPGKARDLSTYIVVHQYWLHSSPENLKRMLAMLVERYVPGYAGRLKTEPPIEYPDMALFHPEAEAPFADLASYQRWQLRRRGEEEKRRRGDRGSKKLSSSPLLPLSSSSQGVVGLLSLRTVALSGNTAHLDALARALEQRGLEVRMAYGAGLDFRPAIEAFFTTTDDRPQTADRKTGWNPFSRVTSKETAERSSVVRRPSSVDVLLNGAGFSLVGGMAESRPEEAVECLAALDVGYLDMIPLAFQRVEEWQADDTGLTPMQLAMNIAIPELDSAAEPLVYGGPTHGSDKFVPVQSQIELAADRIAKRVALRRTPNAEKKLAVVLFNFPPTLGNVGTAAYLDVFAGLHRLLGELKAQGYTLDVPETVEELRRLIVEDNAQLYGTDGSVAARLSLADYRRLFPAYVDIEPFWGRAPGELLTDGQGFYILGKQFGNVFVGLQPSFGYERDPMRLLMAKDAAPHHGFAAFYTWIEHVFGANAVLHFGTHGALEFMPGKQGGMTTRCWPTRLLGTLPNFYYYSVNNPSEATIAKRRGAATLVSYMVPPLQQAGLYKGLRLLKDSLDQYRAHPSEPLLESIRAQAERLGINPDFGLPILDFGLEDNATRSKIQNPKSEEAYVAALAHELLLVEQRMIPVGLHVLGQAPSAAELADVLALAASFVRPPAGHGREPHAPLPQLVAAGLGWDYEALRVSLAHDRTAQERWERIESLVRRATALLVEDFVTRGAQCASGNLPFVHTMTEARVPVAAAIAHGAYLDDLLGRMLQERELPGIVHALEGGYVAPSPGNDVVRNPAVAPTGRNIHGLDPFRVPTPAAQEAGGRLVDELLERLAAQQGRVPETIAMVLWGTDNLKSDGEGVAQALWLLGARPLVDELGKVSDVQLIPLRELGRPRVDVVITVSGIFRDLLSHQMGLLDKAARLAAAADEPIELNFVRKHALAQAHELGVSLDEAAARVFSNAPGSYGANVNHLIESSTWDSAEQLGEAFVGRKSFAYGGRGQWREARAVMESALATVDATFQNVDSFEVGISDIDHYYEYLGGITKSVELLSGRRPPVVLAEALTTTGRLSSLEQLVRLETRAKLLNPKWFEAMLAHGYQGVHEIEARVGNTYGWSATADAVEGWVYQGVADTFVLDEAMRERLAQLNPHATAAITRRLLEANDRGFWDGDAATLDALRGIYADMEDRLEGVHTVGAPG